MPSLDPYVLTCFNYFEDPANMSTRMKALLKDMYAVLKEDPFAKFVIYSQHHESLTALKNMFEYLNEKCIKDDDKVPTISSNSNQALTEELEHHTYIDCVVVDRGDLAKKDRSLSRFVGDPACNVCLLGIGTAATGLTLTVAKVCYILEPLANAADEAQALNRVHRIGQLSAVRCVVFFVAGSCEERILAMRQANGTLTEILSNTDALSVPRGEGLDEISQTGASVPLSHTLFRAVQTSTKEKSDEEGSDSEDTVESFEEKQSSRFRRKEEEYSDGNYSESDEESITVQLTPARRITSKHQHGYSAEQMRILLGLPAQCEPVANEQVEEAAATTTPEAKVTRSRRQKKKARYY